MEFNSSVSQPGIYHIIFLNWNMSISSYGGVSSPPFASSELTPISVGLFNEQSSQAEA